MQFIILGFILAPILIMMSFFISIISDHYKKIGFWWTFFFCMTLSPVVGLALALISPRKNRASSLSEFEQTLILYMSFFSLVAGLFFLIVSFTALYEPVLLFFWSGTGLTGAFLYGIQQLPIDADDYE